MERPSVLFVNGFPGSGTTVLAAALTEAVGGVAEEYGPLLSRRTGSAGLYDRASGVAVLREHVDELRATVPERTVVLKNPSEIGREDQLLRDFPEAGVLILRRRLPDIEASIRRAHRRGSGGGDLRSGSRSALIRLDLCWRTFGLANRATELPAERVAFLSYEELRADPGQAANWAAHLVDPDELAKAYTRHALVESTEPATGGRLIRALDGRWERAWARARAAAV